MAGDGERPHLLEAANLACERGGRLLFEGLSFSLPPGAAAVVTGENGSGKSSLLRIVAGLLPATEGRVAWRGEDCRREPGRWRREMVFLGHLDAVKPALSVRENLAFWGARDEKLLEEMGLAALAGLPAAMLSAGQRRRLALARVAARPGGCWLLDEPAAHLDETSSGRLERMIGHHLAQGGIAVVAAHTARGLGDALPIRLGPGT